MHETTCVCKLHADAGDNGVAGGASPTASVTRYMSNCAVAVGVMRPSGCTSAALVAAGDSNDPAVTAKRQSPLKGPNGTLPVARSVAGRIGDDNPVI